MSEEITSEEIKRIPIKEFRALGFIQEINRRLLHPCGLAIEVQVDTETDEEKFGGVWDYRDDPDGILFAEGVMTREKSESVTHLMHSKMEYRMKNLGYVISTCTR
jgi:hypothetical protein